MESNNIHAKYTTWNILDYGKQNCKGQEDISFERIEMRRIFNSNFSRIFARTFTVQLPKYSRTPRNQKNEPSQDECLPELSSYFRIQNKPGDTVTLVQNRPIYRKKGKPVVETQSKIDVGERTVSLNLGWDAKMYNVGVMLKERRPVKDATEETHRELNATYAITGLIHS